AIWELEVNFLICLKTGSMKITRFLHSHLVCLIFQPSPILKASIQVLHIWIQKRHKTILLSLGWIGEINYCLTVCSVMMVLHYLVPKLAGIHTIVFPELTA